MADSEANVMKITKALELVLLLVGLYIMFQIIKKLLGGSWDAEDIVLALLIFNLGSLFTLGLMLAQIKSDMTSLKEQFRSLATDFKSHIRR